MTTENGERVNEIQAWACGGGTQSGAIAWLIGEGRLPRPDLAYMTDTGREASSTWPFVEAFIKPQIARVGLELEIVPASKFAEVHLFGGIDGILPLLPGYTTQSGIIGKLSSFCSGKWKRDVAERYLRSKGVMSARNWLGISTDEVRRVRGSHREWLQLWYPLIFFLLQSRLDCVQIIRAAGWADPIPHSACYMCPNHSDEEWAEMKRDWPEDFARAIVLENEMRTVDPHFWLHPSCRPLSEVDFTAQHTFFPDRGCSTGCFT